MAFKAYNIHSYLRVNKYIEISHDINLQGMSPIFEVLTQNRQLKLYREIFTMCDSLFN